MDPEYKKLAEARVTGHKGTTLLEVVVITFTAVFINSISVKFFREKTTSSSSSSSITNKIILLLEQWLLLVPPLLILYSSPAETVTYHYTAFFLVFGFLYMFLSSKTTASASASKSSTSSGNNKNNVAAGVGADSATTTTISYDPATAMLRSTLMFHTMTAILQVDFPIFPFRFMKCENFGISLMDVGVGAFVFSGAVTRVAGEEMKRMKAVIAGQQQQKKSSSTTSSSWMSSLRSLIKLLGSSVPLFILGGFRLATVAYTGYQQHLTEYGKHWNFFLTLGFMPLVVALVHKIGSVVRNLGVKLFNNNKNNKSKNDTEQQQQQQNHQSEYILDTVVGLTLLLLHQIALSYPFFGSTDNNLTAYVMSPHRRSLIESNKEGIVSSIGYGALYLIARGVFGLFFLNINNISTTNNTKKSSSSSSSSTGSILLAFIIGTLTVGVTMALDRYVQETSRRLCNAPYVLFCVGGGFITYSICAFVTSSMKSNNNNNNSRLCLLTAIGDNQLPLFLIANLCTGAVNHLMRTIFASTLASYAVMVTYLTVVLGVAVFLSTNNIKLKFW